MKEKEYEISINTIKENIIKVNASSKEEALKSAEEIAMAPNYEKANNTKNTKSYIVGEVLENKPRFLNKSNRFVFLKN